MQPNQVTDPPSNRARFVVGSEMVSFTLSTDATLEDVAMRLRRLPASHDGPPVAIDVTIAATRAVAFGLADSLLSRLPCSNSQPCGKSPPRPTALCSLTGDQM
jgi:hypothetical protein